jgi:hypothetical protein
VVADGRLRHRQLGDDLLGPQSFREGQRDRRARRAPGQLARRLERLRTDYESAKARIAEVGFTCEGSLVCRYTTCNNPNCRCRDPERRHGPCRQLSWKQGGKTVSKLLSAEDAALHEERVANRRRLETALEQMRDLSRQAGEQILAARGRPCHGPKRPRPQRRSARRQPLSPGSGPGGRWLRQGRTVGCAPSVHRGASWRALGAYTGCKTAADPPKTKDPSQIKPVSPIAKHAVFSGVHALAERTSEVAGVQFGVQSAGDVPCGKAPTGPPERRSVLPMLAIHALRARRS